MKIDYSREELPLTGGITFLPTTSRHENKRDDMEERKKRPSGDCKEIILEPYPSKSVLDEPRHVETIKGLEVEQNANWRSKERVCILKTR